MQESGRVGFSPFRMMAALFASAGLFFAVLRGLSVLPAVSGPANLNWLRVHLVTVGTVTMIIFDSLPDLVARRLRTAKRTPGETWLQWGLVNAGFLLIIAGLVGVDPWTATVGATLVFAAVWRLGAGIIAAYRQAGYRWREAMRFYITAPFYVAVGITMAVSLLFDWWAPGGRAGTLEAHVHANVWGFLSMVVAGTLTDRFPAVAGAPLARPGWTVRIYWLMNLGLAGLVAGPWLNLHPLTVAGLIANMTGTVTLVINLILTLAGRRAVNPPALHMVLAYLWMIVPTFFAPFVLFAPHLIRVPAVEAAALQGLVNGWILGVVMGAFGGTWLSVIALNIGVALLWATAVVAGATGTAALMIAGYGLIAVAWVPFLRRLWTTVTAPAA